MASKVLRCRLRWSLLLVTCFLLQCCPQLRAQPWREAGSTERMPEIAWYFECNNHHWDREVFVQLKDKRDGFVLDRYELNDVRELRGTGKTHRENQIVLHIGEGGGSNSAYFRLEILTVVGFELHTSLSIQSLNRVHIDLEPQLSMHWVDLCDSLVLLTHSHIPKFELTLVQYFRHRENGCEPETWIDTVGLHYDEVQNSYYTHRIDFPPELKLSTIGNRNKYCTMIELRNRRTFSNEQFEKGLRLFLPQL